MKLLIGLLTLFAGGNALAAESRAQACDRQWLEESGPYVNRAVPDHAALLKYWLAQKKKCAGTVTYEARLGLIHYFLNDYAEARRVLGSVKDQRSPYYPLIEFVSLTIDLSEIDNLEAAAQPAALNKGRERLEDYTRRNPTSAEGFVMLGSVLSYLEEWPQALDALQQAKRHISPQVSQMGLQRNLAIVNTELGRYEEALDAAQEALVYTTSLQGDPPFMLAVMRSYAALGRAEEAAKATQSLVDRVPGVTKAPEFHRAVADMKRLYEASKARKDAASP